MIRLIPLLLSLAACRADKAGDKGAETGGSSTYEVYPPVGGQGTSVEVSLDASRSVFSFEATTVDFGEGIEVGAVNVDDGFGARAVITIADDAELGDRDVVITTDGREINLDDRFEVISQSFTIDPETARIGETVDIDLVGKNTEWTGGLTWPSFGDGVEVNEFTVLSETLAEANVSITTDAAPGWRNVVMDNGGGSLVTLYDGLKIDRVALAATFDPVEAEQGDTVEFAIFARGTDFTTATPVLSFYDQYGENADIVIDSLSVVDAENLNGFMTLSNAAELGERDVVVQTGEEGVRITDAFEVVGGAWSLEEVAISLSFTVVRLKDNDTGEITEYVDASCFFYIPLDPPCPSGGGSGSGSGSLGDPSPYDVNGVWAVTGSGSSEEEDCPSETTIPAGEYVWLESDANTITMERVYDTGSGQVSYQAQNLTLEDYVTDNWYDLHTQGQDDGIGEYLLEGVQPTVPADWEWTSPDLWGNYTHNRAEDFEFTWTPAETYPDALFVVTLFSKNSLGPMATDEYYGYAGVFPWDDGEHAFTSDEVSEFAAGGIPVYAYSIISGPEFGLPESVYQTNQALSYIYLAQYMVFE